MSASHETCQHCAIYVIQAAPKNDLVYADTRNAKCDGLVVWHSITGLLHFRPDLIPARAPSLVLAEVPWQNFLARSSLALVSSGLRP
jgi:hypothetical protein